MLAVGHDGAKARWGQHAAETCTVGADALCEGALRDVFNNQSALVLLDGGLLVGARVRHDGLLHLVVAHQFAVGHFVVSRVVGDDSEVFNALCNDGVNDLRSASHTEETAEHNRHAVVNLLNGLF